MFKKKSMRVSLILAFSIGGLALSACSTQNGGSRYGNVDNGHCVEMMTCVGIVDRGYWVTPIHHIRTVEVEKEIIVEKEVFVEKPIFVEKEVIVEKEVFKQAPPVTVYEPAPCPAGTIPDNNGACIRTVTVEVPTPSKCPEGTIPGYGGNGCVPVIVLRK